MGFFRPILNQYHLTEQQWRIIRVLTEIKAVDFQELSTRTCILRPSLTGILSRMERDELILKFKPLNDQRKLFVSLAPKGHQLYGQAICQIEAGYKQLEDRFSTEKMKALMALLDEFIAI